MSRDLGLSLANLDAVATSNAEGLSNDNVIPYRATTGRTWPRYLPDIIVIVFPEGCSAGSATSPRAIRSIRARKLWLCAISPRTIRSAPVAR
jgi:hypothetical protein